MAVFRETHLLGTRWWFWALIATGLPRAVMDPPSLREMLVLMPIAFLLVCTVGYAVVADREGVHVRPVGMMVMFKIFYPFIWRRLQAPAGQLAHASAVRRRGIGRVFSWPLLWFGRANQMDFGAPYRFDLERTDGRRIRVGVRDGQGLAAVLRAQGHVVEAPLGPAPERDPVGA